MKFFVLACAFYVWGPVLTPTDLTLPAVESVPSVYVQRSESVPVKIQSFLTLDGLLAEYKPGCSAWEISYKGAKQIEVYAVTRTQKKVTEEQVVDHYEAR